MRKLGVKELNRLNIEDFKAAEKLPIVVVLDNIRSLNNIGSVFRTADAFCLQKIVLCGISACPPNAEIHKTALGAEESMKWEYFSNTSDAVKGLVNDGYELIAIEQVEGSVMLNEFKIDKNKKYALVLGNEVKGVEQEVVDMCTQAIEIPQWGTKHSLNVSVAAGVVLWEFVRLWKS